MPWRRGNSLAPSNFAAPSNVLQIGDVASEGASDYALRSDAVLAFPAPGAPVAVAAAAAAGAADTVARADHVHVGETRGTALAVLGAHEVAPDPHEQYATDDEAEAIAQDLVDAAVLAPITALGDFADVAVVGPEEGHVLVHDGLDWVNGRFYAVNDEGLNVAMGTHEAVAAGTVLFSVDDHGNVFMGQNLLTEGDPTPANNHRGVYDFAWFQNLLRLCVNQLALGTVEDPCDISITRYDAVAGEDAPYAGGDLANLTGLAADTTVAQIRALPALVPEGGDTTTGGAEAPAIGATLNFRTAEMCRVLDDALSRYAVGMDIVFALCAIGFDIESQALLIRNNGVTELRSALRFSGQGENPTVRSGTDGVSNSTDTFVAATGAFAVADVGKTIIIGDPINGTDGGMKTSSGIYYRIKTVVNATTVTLNTPIVYTAANLVWRMEHTSVEMYQHDSSDLRTRAQFSSRLNLHARRDTVATHVEAGDIGGAAGLKLGEDTTITRLGANLLSSNADVRHQGYVRARNGDTGQVVIGTSATPKIEMGTGAATAEITVPANHVVAVNGAIKTEANTTGNRPSAVTAGAGAHWYDTTLAKPIFSDGAVWRDAAGNAV